MRAAINQFQVENLETRDSKIHNRGVHLKQGKDLTIARNQVVAIYDGTPIFCRSLTHGEKNRAGFSRKDSSEKQLVWSNPETRPETITRPASFQSYSYNICYRDRYNRKVWLGMDALDSELPVSNINSAKWSNIDLLPCLDTSMVLRISGTDLFLQTPFGTGFCLLAVARKNIPPESELTVRYGDLPLAPEKKPHFWGPEQYFFPFLSPIPVTIEFSEGGSTCLVRAKTKQPDKELAALRTILESAFREGLAIYQIVPGLNVEHNNPFTGQPYWTAGCIQLLCQLWNYVHFKGFRHLTALCHCRDANGKLDNNGINYMTGFIRNRVPSVPPPQSRPVTMDNVMDWLQSAIEEMQSRPDTPEKQDELPFLEEEYQLLRIWQWRALNAPESRQLPGTGHPLVIEEERERLKACIMKHYEKVHPPGKQDGPRKNFPYDKLSSQFLLPHELWPDKLRPSIWRHAHIQCMPLYCPPVPDYMDKPEPVHILACYRPDTKEYTDALAQLLARKQAEGVTLQNLVPGMIPRGDTRGTVAGKARNRHTIDYLIPHVPEIPQELRGTCSWADVTPEQWQHLGFNPAVEVNLKTAMERLFAEKSEDTIRRLLADQHSHLWENDPSLKQSLKDQHPSSWALLSHLIHFSGADVQVNKARWKPENTLMICAVDTEPYRQAMRQFLEEQLAARVNAYEMARQLQQANAKSIRSQELQAATTIELPASIKEYGQWTGAAVVDLIQAMGIVVPEQFELLPDNTFSLKNEIQQFIKNSSSDRGATLYQTIKSQARKRSDYADALKALAEGLQLDCDKLLEGKGASVRIILRHLGITVPDKGKLQSELKVKTFDQLSAMANNHPDWNHELLRLVDRLGQNYSPEDIASALQKGERNARKIGEIFGPIPLPPGVAAEAWDAGILDKFLRQQGRMESSRR